MGWLDNFLIKILKLEPEKAKKVKSIMGGIFILAITNLPFSDMVLGWELKSIWTGYLMIIWSGLVIAMVSLIVLFFGKPPPNIIIPDEVEEVVSDEPTEIVINTTSTTDTAEWTSYDGNTT